MVSNGRYVHSFIHIASYLGHHNAPFSSKNTPTGPETIIPHASRNPSPAHWQDDRAICLSFLFFPISHISQGLFCRSRPHLISYPGFVSALSWQHNQAQRCLAEKCQIKAKDLIWERRNAFHIPSQKIWSGAGWIPNHQNSGMTGDQGHVERRTHDPQSCITTTLRHLSLEVIPAVRNVLWTGHRSITGPFSLCQKKKNIDFHEL